MSARLKWTLALVGVLLHAALVAAVVSPGHLSIDEATYHLMSRAMADGGLSVANGYERVASTELELGTLQHGFVVAKAGRLVGKYPPLFAALTAPLYPALGYRALFLLNALAFGLVVCLLWPLAARVCDDKRLAPLAAVVFVAATYSWQYAWAAWPHTTPLALILLGLLLTLEARAQRGARALWLAAGSGLATGVAVAVRLDSIFILPALLVLQIDKRQWLALSLATAAGLVPALAGLALVNHARFDTWMPLSYGESAGQTLKVMMRVAPAAAVGLVGVAARISLDRPALRQRAARLLRPALVVAGLALVAALLVPTSRAVAERLAEQLLRIVVDLRLTHVAQDTTLARGPGGEVLYIGGIKKAFLQSCPYLFALLVPLVAARRGSADARRLLVLYVPVLIYLAGFGMGGWHGGLGLNMRYLLPTLPFTSLLAAWALLHLADALPEAWRRALPVVAVACAAVMASLLGAAQQVGEQSRLVQDLPLLLAALGGGATLVWARESARQARIKALAVLLVVSLGHAGATALAYDLPLTVAWRSSDHALTEVVEPHLDGAALIFASPYGQRFGLYGLPGVSVADPTRDRFEGFRRLADTWLAAGDDVFGYLPADGWRWLRADPRFEGLEATPLAEHRGFVLARISAR